MEVEGIILNSVTQEGVPRAQVILRIEDKEIAVLFSDRNGRFKYSTAQSFNGKTLTCASEKEGFQPQEVEYNVDKDKVDLRVQIAPKSADIEVQLSLVDTNSNAVEGGVVGLHVGGENVGGGVSGSDGLVKSKLASRWLGQTLSYAVEKQGFLQSRGHVLAKEKTDLRVELALEGKEIELTFTLKDTHGDPIKEGVVELKAGKQLLSRDLSNTSGVANLRLASEWAGKTVNYVVEKAGYIEASGEVVVQTGAKRQIELIQDRGEAELTVTLVDIKNKPLKAGMITLYSEGQALVGGVSDKKGQIALKISSQWFDRVVDYSADRKGYQQAKGKIQVKPTVYHTITLEKSAKPRKKGWLRRLFGGGD